MLIKELKEEFEEAAIAILVAIGKHCPGDVVATLQERFQPKVLPHHSVLCAMEKLCQLSGTIFLNFLLSEFLVRLESVSCYSPGKSSHVWPH